MEVHKSGTSEGKQLVRELRSEIVQLQALAVPPDPTRGSVIQDLRFEMNRQEAKKESQKAVFFSLRKDVESTQDSLNYLDEFNLSSIQGVYVDDSIGTSITSVSRVTEPAISQPREAFHAESSTKLAAAPSNPPGSKAKVPLAVPSSSRLFRLKLHFQQSQPLILEDPKREKLEQLTIDKWPQPTESRSWKISFKSEVHHSSPYPGDVIQWSVEVEDAKSIDDLIYVCIFDRKINTGLRES